MYFVQILRVVDGKTYTNRIGKPYTSFATARNLAIVRKGHIVNEAGELVGQSEFPRYDKYLPRMVNISSGESTV